MNFLAGVCSFGRRFFWFWRFVSGLQFATGRDQCWTQSYATKKKSVCSKLKLTGNMGNIPPDIACVHVFWSAFFESDCRRCCCCCCHCRWQQQPPNSPRPKHANAETHMSLNASQELNLWSRRSLDTGTAPLFAVCLNRAIKEHLQTVSRLVRNRCPRETQTQSALSGMIGNWLDLAWTVLPVLVGRGSFDCGKQNQKLQ